MLTNFNALALGLGPSIKVKERSFNNNEDISIFYLKLTLRKAGVLSC